MEPNDSQSIKFQDSKYQFETLNCTLEELTILELVARNSVIKQQALVEVTGKSIATAKRLMKSLQVKNYIRRESGRRYGEWEIVIKPEVDTNGDVS